ncbi:MAG: hypothetical protein AAB510_01895 [Patescibacteria group bacterium]
MAEIIPAILPKNYEDLKNKITQIHGLASLVQIDICDGIFVKSTTWPFPKDEHFQRILNEQQGMPFWEDTDFELDLMVCDAIENFNAYLKLGPKRVVFHFGARDVQNDIEEFKHFLEGIDMYIRDSIRIGVAISTSTPVQEIFPLVNYVDFVQVMGIKKIGYQGEEFDFKCLEYIRNLKEKYSDIVISVDGGVNLDTAPALISAGADYLVIGSAIFNSGDIVGTIREFESL